MTKQMCKTMCDLNMAAYKRGCKMAGIADVPTIILTKEKFEEFFGMEEYQTAEDGYKYRIIEEDGYTFMCHLGEQS